MNFRLPVVQGRIARRLLVNFRVQPARVAALLPPPFQPKLVRGFALAGICLIRLEEMRPQGLPAVLGLASENAAHRFAVEWTEQGNLREGVFIPRRHSGSVINCAVGGCIFPGLHERALFAVEDDGEGISLRMEARDDDTRVEVTGRRTVTLPDGSVFRTLEEASVFFRTGSLGWSPSTESGCCEGLELCNETWTVEPFAVEEIRTSFFEDARRFPPGSMEFDCALVMRGIQHEWRAKGRMGLQKVTA